jgi:hydroxybutyrate-dimer hydrolase
MDSELQTCPNPEITSEDWRRTPSSVQQMILHLMQRLASLEQEVSTLRAENGGAAAIRAAEQDSKHLIDGVAVSEPNVNPKPSNAFSIVQGSQSPVTNHSKSLYDYTTQVNLFQPCANLTASNASAPFNIVSDTFEGNRCQSLKDKGLLTAAILADVPAISQTPANDARITFVNGVVQIPE